MWEKVIGRATGARWSEKKMWIIREWIIREWIIREWGRLTRWMGGYALKKIQNDTWRDVRMVNINIPPVIKLI